MNRRSFFARTVGALVAAVFSPDAALPLFGYETAFYAPPVLGEIFADLYKSRAFFYTLDEQCFIEEVGSGDDFEEIIEFQ